MKLKAAALLVAISLVTVFSQEVSINRGQFWGRITVAPQFENGWSGLLSASMRDNFEITKEVNGNQSPASLQGNWLNEFYLGVGWKHRLGKSSVFANQLIYRPQFWYSDGVAGEPYLRHTFMNSSNIFHKLKPFTIHHRVTLWGLLETRRENPKFDNEFVLRYMVGPEFRVGSKTRLFVKVEPFLKLTADDSDLDGTELFSRFYTWSGIDFKPTPSVKLSLQYVNMKIFATETKTVLDHTIYMNVTLMPSWK